MTSAIDCVPLMVSIREASSRSGLSYDAIRKRCLCGQIVHIRAGSKYYINLPRLLEYLNTAVGSGSKKEG